MADTKYFSKIDLFSGFWQVEIEEKDKEKTSFCTPFGSYEYNRMAFGLVGAPSTYQRLMDGILSGLKGISCFVYLDDIIIFSSNIMEHANRLSEVLQRLRDANLKAHPLKCSFAVDSIEYLGHIVTKDGVLPDPAKIKAIREFPTPNTPTQVRSFLGLVGYYRRHISNFAKIAKPLTDLTRKDKTFEWKEEQQQAFNILRKALCTEAILKYPDFKRSFILATDASGVALGAVLSQKHGEIEHPIAYASRVLNKAEQSYSVTERELLALVWATKYFRCYLYGRKFTAITDHAALKWLLSLKDPSSRLLRWTLRLSEFEFDVQYKPGKKHNNADALSRVYVMKSKDFDINSVRRYQIAEPQYPTWLNLSDKFKLDSNGVLFYVASGKDFRLVVPTPMRQSVMSNFHDTPV